MRKKFFSLSLLFIFAFLLPLRERTFAAYFSLEPATKTLNSQENLTLNIKIDTEGKEAIGAEATLSFNPSILEFLQANSGSFFTTFHSSQTANQIRVAGTIGLSGTPKAGTGPLAGLTFKAKEAGTANLEFICGGIADSNIIAQNPADPTKIINIINCSSLVNGQYTVLAADAPTPTPGGAPGTGGSSTCDLCGYCAGGAKPADYEKCLTCLYENPGPPPSDPKDGYSFTVIGCLPTAPATFIQKTLQFIIALAGGISFLLLLFGGFKILTSKGDPNQLAAGKNLVVSTIIALLLILFAVFLLRFIGFEILKIPGFGG